MELAGKLVVELGWGRPLEAALFLALQLFHDPEST